MRHKKKNSHPEVRTAEAVNNSLTQLFQQRLVEGVNDWALQECHYTAALTEKTKRIANTNLILGRQFMADRWPDLKTTAWTENYTYIHTQTDVIQIRLIDFFGRKMLVAYSIWACNDEAQLSGPAYIDLENAIKAQSDIELSAGIVAWLLAGGIWVVPELNWTVQDSETAARAVSEAVSTFREISSLKDPKIFIGVPSPMIAAAVSAVTEEENLCNTLFFKNVEYSEDSNPANIPDAKIDNIFYLSDNEHAKDVYRIGVEKNHFLSLFFEEKPSILDDDNALAFLLRRSII